jgi:hypothetical protein
MGYLRSALKRAQRDLQDSLDNVALYCGVSDHLLRMVQQSSTREVTALRKEKLELEKRVKELEAEVRRLGATK